MTHTTEPTIEQLIAEYINSWVDWNGQEQYEQQIADFKAIISDQVAKARIDTAQMALNACPTKDEMLRVWLTQHIATLSGVKNK